MKNNSPILLSTKDCAYISVFVALVIVTQLLFSAIPGVELVTLLFASFSFVFGALRGSISATIFSILRQILFGFYPNVLILYLIYYNFLTIIFGLIGLKIKSTQRSLILIIVLACFCTSFFTILDNIITPIYYSYSIKARELYFKSSIPFMLSQCFCTSISVGCLFLPLCKIFSLLKGKEKN